MGINWRLGKEVEDLAKLKEDPQELLWRLAMLKFKWRHAESFHRKKRYRYIYNRGAKIYNEIRKQDILTYIPLPAEYHKRKEL